MKKLLDHIGVILSCTCLIHCILLPFVIILTQVDLHIHGFHEIMIGLTILISGSALYHGYKKHCKHIVLAYGMIGVLCMIVALLGSELFELIATSIGSTLLLLAHIFNIRFQKCCTNTQDKTIENYHKTYN